MPRGLGDDLVRHHREPGRRPQRLLHSLVHTEGAPQDTGTHVGHPGKLEQALDGAVFAARSVQDGEHHVEIGPRAVGQDQRRGVGLVVGEPSEDAGTRHDLRQPAGLRGQGRWSGKHVPAPVARDANRDDLRRRRIQGVDHGARRQATDLVLGGSPAEQDGHAAAPLAHHAAEPTGRTRRPDIDREDRRRARSANPSLARSARRASRDRRIRSPGP